MSVKLNGRDLPDAVVKSAPHDNAGKRHGEFYIEGLRPTHSSAQRGQFGPGPQPAQEVGFTRNGSAVPILGASVEVDGVAGRVVAISNERVEWEEN